MFDTTRQRRHMRDRNRQYTERAHRASRWGHSPHSATQTWRWMLGAAVLAGLGAVLLWSRGVALAHLDWQMADSDPSSRALLDIHQAASALTPDNIEHWVLALSLELQANRLTETPGGDPRPRPFEIGLGEPALYIAYRLQDEGFVTDAELFNLYLRVQFLDRYLEAGNFMLSETMTIPELAAALNAPSYEEELVTLLEGMRMEEFAEVLEANYIVSAREFLDVVRAPRSMEIFDDYDFLANLPTDATLEGYLFPDTYRFPVNADRIETVVAKFLDNFDRRLGERNLTTESALTPREIVILASIVEREAIVAEERPLIASVYLNRLSGLCWDEVRGPYLESDPTVQYPLGNAADGWWPAITLDDYDRVQSPYNTFQNPGLPPAPISNPGLSSLDAVRSPANSIYCFFHTTGIDGTHVFAATYAEHRQNTIRYGQ